MTLAFRSFHWVLACLFAFTWVVVVGAQTTSTEIAGQVRDETGGIMPGAEVTLTHLATGQVRRALTNDVGRFAFPLIEPGEYQLHVEMPGFRAHTLSRLTVQFQQRRNVDVVLQIGELADEVLVEVGAMVLRTEEAAVAQAIESERIVELPVNTRNVGHLAVLVPGVTFGNRMGATDGMGGQSPPGTTVALVAHGQHSINQTVTLDGSTPRSRASTP